MAFRFIHTADLHLDSPLRSLALRDPDLAEMIATASRLALGNIIDLCLSEQVDALLIAGDLYDGSQTSMKTARFLAAELARLDQGGIRCFIIRGNHDAESRITRELTLPSATHVFTSRAGVEVIEKGPRRYAIHGLSFRDKHAPDSLLPQYQPPLPDAVNIGMMHTSLDGAIGHDNYAPCALSDLQASGFDYWALGHIHKRADHGHIVMPGIPQGRDIGEQGAGSVTLVTVDDDGKVHTAAHVVALAAFEPVRVDLTGCDDWHDMRARLRRALADAQTPCPHLVARITLSGQTPIAARLYRDRDLALAEAQDIAHSLGATWVENLRFDFDKGQHALGPLADLATLIESDIRTSDSYAMALESLRRDLERALPPEIRDEIAQIAPELQDHGIAEVLARLGGQT